MVNKKLVAAGVVMSIFASSLVGCGGSSEEGNGGNSTQIYFLNFKPEIADVYKSVAKDYEKETGVKVKVETAASGDYEQTLKSEMAKSEAPTIFQINGPVGYNNWKNYCLDLKDTDLYNHLSDKSLAVTDGDGVYGIPYAVEGYGIIYNQEIMDKYIALSNKKADITSVDDINNFDILREVVEDMQANKDKLGIDGVFASTSMSSGNRWRWDTHLANLPFYYEFKDESQDDASIIETGLASETVEFEYNDNYKNIFDLYLDNSCTEKGLLGNKSVDDSMSEFALGKCAMVQNGNWAWGQVAGVDGNKVLAENVKYLPIYTGVEGEESQGLCTGTENFFCINAKASEAEQKAAADFIYWLYSSTTGKDFVTNKLGFIAPFDTFEENEKPTDPLAKEVLNWMSKDGVTSVAWNFTLFPSQTFKDNFGSALLQYAQGTKTWEEVKTQVVNDWASESVAAE